MDLVSKMYLHLCCARYLGQLYLMLHVKVKEAYLYTAYYELLISRRSGMACVNEGSHSFTSHPHVYPQVEWTIAAFNPQPQSIAALWLVVISRPAEGRRLSWPRWLGEILEFARPETVTHPSVSRSSRESNLWLSVRESNALTTRLPRHPRSGLNYVTVWLLSSLLWCVASMCAVDWHQAMSTKRRKRLRRDNFWTSSNFLL